MRVHFSLAAFLFIALLGSGAAFATEEKALPPNPYTEVVPFTQKDKLSVVIFFKFSCPACRSMHSSLDAWSKTLPKGISSQFNPVVEPNIGGDISRDSIYGLQAYWVAERLANQVQKDYFVSAAYSLVQDEKAGLSGERWLEALIRQRIPAKSIQAAWKAEAALGPARIERQMHYKPTATPSMVICGRWMISPENTNGDPDLFAQLANALVSQCADSAGFINQK